MKKKALLWILTAAMLTGCSAGQENEPVKLNKNKPVNLTIWHYYNGSQKAAFDTLVSEFNETAGKEQGIYVEGHSKGDVSELERAVLSSAKKEVGSEEMPSIFSSYADTAHEIDKAGMLADLSQYLSAEEQAEYVDSYIEEGRIGTAGELRIFPVAKSTEVLMMNKTVWDTFSAETGASMDELATVEGVAGTAELYYNWTDAQTPEIVGDGKAFYGRDAMANLFIITSMQMGVELFQVENGTVTLNIDRAVFKNIWDTYYIPYVKGYFGAYGRFRSDDVKIGELAAYTGSIASASYFPDGVEVGDTITPIECTVLAPPHVDGGDACIIQQGAGMVVSKKTKEEEFASVEFLKWFTENENNIEFGSTSGYVPVKKGANKQELLDKAISEKNLTIAGKEYNTLLLAYRMVDDNELYTNKAFDGGTAARKILEYNLSDKARADREQVKTLVAEGIEPDAAASDFISDKAFDEWFESIKKALEESVAD